MPALDAARDLRLLRSALGAAQPDFYSAHFYWRPELAAEHLRAAVAAVAPLPLRVGETGYSTAIPYDVLPGVPASASAREAEQAYYLRSLANVTRRLGLPPIAPWVLSDFAPDAIPPDDPGLSGNAREYRFGLFRVSGEAKPAAAAVRTIFSGGQSDGFNNGFEQAVRDERGLPLPALWRIRPARGAAFTRDVRMARTGRASARIDGAAAGTGPDAAFAIAPSDPGGPAGRPLYRDRVRARRLTLRPRGHRAALVRERRTRRRWGAVGVAPLWHPRLEAPAGERDCAGRRRLRRHLSARRAHRRPSLVRRRRLLLCARSRQFVSGSRGDPFAIERRPPESEAELSARRARPTFRRLL